jgi:hypothetical protein
MRRTDLWVYRASRPLVGAAALREGLAQALDDLAHGGPAGEADRAERALLRAGELECALADHGAPRLAEIAALVDALADRAVGTATAIPRLPPELLDGLPPRLAAAPPEGFAYHALAPASFARAAAALDMHAAAVIGVRTIGLTLAAITAAALRRRGVIADRASVRPDGHPYARALAPSAELAAWIAARCDRGATFLVVDEGPGLSGSTFLAVAEALTHAGVPAHRIRLIGSRAADPASLLAQGAAQRFAAFPALLAAEPAPPPEERTTDLSAGAWRTRFLGDPRRWPAVWPTLERRKHLSADGRTLLKFEGLGRWGDAVRARAATIAAAGFGPPVADAGSGFARLPLLAGRPLTAADATPTVIARLADYCAFRAAAFPAPDADPRELAAMIAHDAQQLTGRAFDLHLPVERPVIADARLHPHEWIGTPGAAPSKIDASAHGDDALFPGPVDVAWDLAGAIVEWDLSGGARRAFLDRYTAASGDRPEARLPAYLAAYRVLSAARASLAAATLAGDEAARHDRDRDRYLRRLAEPNG